MIATTADHRAVGMAVPHSPGRSPLPVVGIDAVLSPALHNRVAHHEPAAVEDTDRAGNRCTSTTRRVRSGTL